MIRNLNPQSFRGFGTILSGKEQISQLANHHSISLSRDTAYHYQTVADTWLCSESGLTVLSVSADNETFYDFHLDKPVRLHGGVWFSLTGYRGSACVQLSAFSYPRLLKTAKATDRFTIHPKLQVTSLYTFFYQEQEQGFVFPGEAHAMAELIYVDRGSVHSVADGQDLLLEKGDLVFYPPQQWHMLYADIGVAPRLVTVTFDIAGCDYKNLMSRKFTAGQKVMGLLQHMLRELEKMEDDYASDLILNLLNAMIISLLRQVHNPAEKVQPVNGINNENDIIRRAQQYITGNVREKLSVPLVAKNVDVSASYLTALFHKHLQISPGEYIRRIKLQESKQMIREGNLNFTQISEALQYSTVHHFSRQFKEKFGITPSEYAKSVR